MMITFFFCLLIVGLIIKSMTSDIKPSNNSICKGHTWVYKNLGTDQEYMVCQVCHMLPGTDLKEEGEGFY